MLDNLPSWAACLLIRSREPLQGKCREGQQPVSADRSFVDAGAFPAVDRRLSAPLLSQQVHSLFKARIELQHARDSDQQFAVERLARLVAIGLVRRQELAILQIVEDRMAVIQLKLRSGAGVENGQLWNGRDRHS